MSARGRVPLLVASVAAVLTVLACSGERRPTRDAALAKIHLDLESINSQGLAGPPDGLEAVSYEFCIPADESAVSEVEGIDPTVEVQRGARGRVGCRDDQFLCVGHTHQPDFRSVLIRLASLDYIASIEPFYGE